MLRSIALIAASLLLVTSSYAADFYQSKQITIVVGFSTGGTYDAGARLFARHLGRHLAGNPTVVVRNMPGSGNRVAALHLAHTAPRDGTTLGVIGGGTLFEALLGNRQAKFEGRQFNWIGGCARDNFLCAVWHTVPVQTMADVVRRETAVSATGPGSRTLSYPRALNETDVAATERGGQGLSHWAIGSIVTRTAPCFPMVSPDLAKFAKLDSMTNS